MFPLKELRKFITLMGFNIQILKLLEHLFESCKTSYEAIVYILQKWIALDMLMGKNGQEKLDPLPLIILLDINLPKMDGFEFLKIIRSNPEFENMKVFVMTTSNEECDKIMAKKFDVTGI